MSTTTPQTQQQQQTQSTQTKSTNSQSPTQTQEKPQKKEKKEDKEDPNRFALNFSLPKDLIEKKTANQIKQQIKSQVETTIGPVDECRVTAAQDGSQDCLVVFVRVLTKGQPFEAAVRKGEKKTIEIFDKDIDVILATSIVTSKGGRGTNTASKPSVKPPKGRNIQDVIKQREEKKAKAKEKEKEGAKASTAKDGEKGKKDEKKTDDKKPAKKK